MESVIRAIAIYVALTILFRVTGRRSMSHITTFDFVLLLVVGEATQQALLGEDFSIVHGALVIATLLLMQRASDFLAFRSKTFDRVTEGVPTLLISDGQVLTPALETNLLDEADILEAARDKQGLERLDQIKWAVLEKSGSITVVPKDQAAPSS